MQGRDEKLNNSVLDGSSDDLKDFVAIRTSSPCLVKERDDNYNMDVDNNDGKVSRTSKT